MTLHDFPIRSKDITLFLLQVSFYIFYFQLKYLPYWSFFNHILTGTPLQNTFNSYTGSAPNASSGGILVFGGCGDPLSTGVEVEGNVLSDNDVGIYLNNYNSACTAPVPQKTNDKALSNSISNDAVTNMSAFTAADGSSYTGYQAGIDDIGNNDLISHNTIAGIGYTPAQTTPGGPFVIPIDTISFPTTHPRIRANRVI